MCLAGNEATMIETLNALNDARLQLVQWTAPPTIDVTTLAFTEDLNAPRSMLVSREEGVWILERRIAGYEAKCRELGIHGPAPKADPGDQRRIVDAK